MSGKHMTYSAMMRYEYNGKKYEEIIRFRTKRSPFDYLIDTFEPAFCEELDHVKFFDVRIRNKFSGKAIHIDNFEARRMSMLPTPPTAVLKKRIEAEKRTKAGQSKPAADNSEMHLQCKCNVHAKQKDKASEKTASAKTQETAEKQLEIQYPALSPAKMKINEKTAGYDGHTQSMEQIKVVEPKKEVIYAVKQGQALMRSHYEMLRSLPADVKGKMLVAIFDYGFDRVSPTFRDCGSMAGEAEKIWSIILPDLKLDWLRFVDKVKDQPCQFSAAVLDAAAVRNAVILD